MNLPKYYTAAEVAEIYRRDPHTIRDWINHGCATPNGLVRLQAIKLGKSWTIREDWIAIFEIQVRPDFARPNLGLE